MERAHSCSWSMETKKNYLLLQEYVGLRGGRHKEGEATCEEVALSLLMSCTRKHLLSSARGVHFLAVCSCLELRIVSLQLWPCLTSPHLALRCPHIFKWSRLRNTVLEDHLWNQHSMANYSTNIPLL